MVHKHYWVLFIALRWLSECHKVISTRTALMIVIRIYIYIYIAWYLATWSTFNLLFDLSMNSYRSCLYQYQPMHILVLLLYSSVTKANPLPYLLLQVNLYRWEEIDKLNSTIIEFFLVSIRYHYYYHWWMMTTTVIASKIL